ncbi:YSIRK-type signal peptide-containing protein [uncultured Limosilactobacillus sp.]|uniref:mucin-binding protein n=1 Tax=uncultured Limosilactobacillus sp. TaxID=2837629 RepID=UPI0025EC56F6|nr:YSIRK-type signal peptide-containing protein [uncultured Limosilactobacillus sp.]
MGKNNLQIVRRKTVSQRQRFGLRKLGVGVASVMLGVTFFAGQGLVAHADSNTTTDQATVAANSSVLTQSGTSDKTSHQGGTTAQTDQEVSAKSTGGGIVGLTRSTSTVENSSTATAPAISTTGDHRISSAPNTSSTNDQATASALVHDEAKLTLNFKDNVNPDNHFAAVTISGQLGKDVADQLIQAIRQKEAQHYVYDGDDGKLFYYDYGDKCAALNKSEVTLNQAHQTVTISLGHHYKWVYHNQPTNQPGLTKDDLNHTYMQTINYVYPDSSQNKTVVNTLTAYRSAKVDETTGEISYDKWTYTDYKNEWPEIVLPSASGKAYLDPAGWHYYDPDNYSPTKVRYEPVWYEDENADGQKILRGRKCDGHDVTINAYLGNITYHLKYVNALTGQTLAVPTKHKDDVTDGRGNYDVQFGLNAAETTIGQFQSSQLNGPFIASIPGYKFVEGDLTGTDIKGDYNVLKDQQIGSTDRTLVLKYAPLSPIEIQFVDQDRNQVLKKITMPTTDALPGTVGDAEKIGPYNYETHQLDDIPGYEYTGKHSANVDGFVGQIQTKDSKNPIVVKYYYQEIPGQSKVAEYTRKSLEVPYLDDSWVPTLNERYDGDPIDYTGVDQGVKDHSEKTGFEFIGALNSKDGRYSSKTKTILTYVFTPRQKVTVNYINLLTGKKMTEANGADSTVMLTPTAADDNHDWQWTSDQKAFAGYHFVSVDRSTSGKYGFLEQEVNYYYLPVAKQETDQKTAKRIIHFVTNRPQHESLQDNQTQVINYTTTYYTYNGKLVNVKAVQQDGKTIYVVDPANQETPQKVWHVATGGNQGVVVSGDGDSYQQVQQDQVDVTGGALKGHWVIEKAAQETVDGPVITTNDAPQEQISSDIANGTVENVYLIYDLTNSHDEQMTFTRQVNYRGTKDGGQSYQDVNGSPDGKSHYQQTLTFTRHVVQNSRNEVISTSEWVPQTSNELATVVSQRPSQVGYDMVDVDRVDAKTINPHDYHYTGQPIDLGTTTVTYRTNVAQNKTVTRHIYYHDAVTGEKISDELAKQGIHANVPDITQTVNYTRLAVYDKFGVFLGYAQLETGTNGLAKKDANGQPIAKKGVDGQPLIAGQGANDGWVPFGSFAEYPAQGSPDLTRYGYKQAQSSDQVTNKGDAAEVATHTSTPAHDGDDLNVYYFHDQEEVDGTHPGVEADQLTKTFTRTIVYRGTRDHGQSYQDVNGSPTGTHRYVQTLTFTRKAIIDSVTHKVLGYTNWTADQSSFAAVDSQSPVAVDYQTVDRPEVSALTVDPDSDQTDLGTVIVTYQAEPQPTTGHPGTNQLGSSTGKETDDTTSLTQQRTGKKQSSDAQKLPQTGNDRSAVLACLGLFGLLLGFGWGQKKQD